MYINKNLQEIAYNYLMEKIMEEVFDNDEIYSEEKIAQELGISRTPVRAALQRLNHDNYIDIIPYRGFKLHQTTISDIIQSFQLRCAIEGYCCSYIAKKYNTEKASRTLNELTEILGKQKNILENNRNLYEKDGAYTGKREDINLNEFLEFDVLFHKTIVEFAENQVFNSTFNSYVSTIKFLARSYYKSVIPITIDEHYNILSSMSKGDVDNSYNSLVNHMITPTKLYLKKFNADLDFF
ncbi:MAG TPA: GntR family transcriptional regulator [Clostridiales bacterium]|nr:GntR family transcriptional regulator [Clostridiales bacterium]